MTTEREQILALAGRHCGIGAGHYMFTASGVESFYHAARKDFEQQLAEKCAEIENVRRANLDCVDHFNAAMEDLTAAHAQIQHLKASLVVNALRHTGKTKNEIKDEIERLFPSDTSALEAIVKQAGEVMRERCWITAQPEDSYQDEWFKAKADSCARIRTLPCVKLEDLK